jgi:cytosol aminopeptidase family protein
VSTGALHELRIEPLVRALLEGVPDPDEPGARKRLDLAVVAYFEDERPLRGLGAFLDWRCGGKLSRLLRTGFCSGRAGEAVLMPGRRDLPSVRVVMYGLGPRRVLAPDELRTATVAAVHAALRLRPVDVLFAMPGLADDRELAEAVLQGVVVGLGGTPPQPRGSVVGGVEDDDAVPRDAKLRISSGPIALDRSSTTAGVHPAGDELTRAFADDHPVPALPFTGDDADLAAPRRAATDDDGRGREPAGLGEPDMRPDVDPPAPTPCRWWVVADPRHVGRLRRLLDGPPRAATP